MRLRFVGEGPDDVGREGVAGIAQILVRRLLSASSGRPTDTSGWGVGVLVRKHQGTGLPQKAHVAIKEAHREGFDGVVILLDRDGKRVGGDRLSKLREGRRAAAMEVPTAAVVGIAIETIEAWLLADESAMSRAIGVSIPRQPDPETLDGAKGTPRHPKVVLAACLAQARVKEMRSADIKRRIAEEADLQILEARCSA
jgi:hypothetical protein